MVQVQAAADGTFTFLLNGQAKMTGLTKAQADKLAASFEARADRAAAASVAHEAVTPTRPAWSWRALFGPRRSAC